VSSTGSGVRSKRRTVERAGDKLHVAIATAVESQQLSQVGTALVEEIRKSQPRELVIELAGVESLDLAQVESIIDLMTIARVLSVEPTLTGMSHALTEQLHRDGTSFRHGVK
jgi:anti-anti-sigma regulatory factor